MASVVPSFIPLLITPNEKLLLAHALHVAGDSNIGPFPFRPSN